MIKPKILVTSATGKTGSAAVQQLLEKEYPVRAFVHRKDHRSEALEKAGAEVFVGDMLDLRDLRRALTDVQRAYFVAAMGPNTLYTGMNFAVAAEEAKLEVVAAMSQWTSGRIHPSLTTREIWLTDQILPWMPSVDVVTVNPGWFADNYFFVLEVIAQLGVMPMPLGQGLNAPASNEDMARVAVGALINPAPHIGKSYRPTGPKLLSPEEIAATFAKVMGRRVQYRDISEKLLLKALKAQGFPDFGPSQLRYYVEDYRRNAFAIGAPTNAVLEVGGREPEDFETIVRRYVANSPGAVRTVGNRIKAIRFFIKMLMTPAPDMDSYERRRDHALLREPEFTTASEEWLAEHVPPGDAYNFADAKGAPKLGMTNVAAQGVRSAR